MQGRIRVSTIATLTVPLFLVGLFVVNALTELDTRVIDHDEVQHLHIAWRVDQGDRPYVDFADNHNHLFPALLRWTLPAGDDPATPVALGRAFMAACTVLTLLLAGLLAAQWSRPSAALLAPVALAGSGFWMIHGLTVRPDVPMTTLVLAGWLLFARGRRRRSLGLMVGAGLAWGLGTALLLKAALAVFPAGLLLLADVLRRSDARREALLLGLGCLGGLLLPLGAFVAWTASQGLLGPFWFWVVEFNASYLRPSVTDPGFGVGEVLAESASRDTALLVLAAVGLLPALLETRGDGVMVAMLGYAGLVLLSTLRINQPNYQYLLPALTLLPILGAAGIDGLAARVGRRWAAWSPWVPPAALAVTALLSFGALRWVHTLPDNAAQIARMERVLELVPPGRTLLAAPPAHPILRRDALYLWFNNPRFHNVLLALRPPAPMDRWETDPARLVAEPPDVIVTTGARYHGDYRVGALAGQRYLALSQDPEVLVLDDRVRELTGGATAGSGSAP
jgi:4-amino-4-deoxy-L-arabinose transferase-like glycosyltransferase